MTLPTIGRYEIKSELGRGGMATVYHAYDPRFQRDVALKVLPREFMHDPTFLARFEREAQTVAVLEHPAIVPVYDFGEEGGQPYLVMRYLPGGSLTRRLEKGTLSIAEIDRIIDYLAPGLDEAHRLGIVHRDLKPDNILFDQRDNPVITDFGIAKQAAESSDLTSGSVIIGTPAYMSPEQANGEELDGRSDIYSLGVIVFQMLTGRQPYYAQTPIGVIMKHITEPIPRVRDLNADLSAGLETVIAKVLAKDRDERYATAVELSVALHGAISARPTIRLLKPEPKNEHPFPPLETNELPRPETPEATVTRPLEDHTTECPYCNAINSDIALLCTTCGKRIKVECTICHTRNPLEAVHCIKCGSNLKRNHALRQASMNARKRNLASRGQAIKGKKAKLLKEKLHEIFEGLQSWGGHAAASRLLQEVDNNDIQVLIDDLIYAPYPEDRISSVLFLQLLCGRTEISTELKAQATDGLIDGLEDADPDVRKTVQEALEEIGKRRPGETSDIFKSIIGWFKGK